METACNHCSKMSGGGFARTEPTLWLYEKNCNTQEWTILRPKLENIDQWSSFRTTGRCFVVKDQHHAVALHLAEWKYCNNIDRLSIKNSMPLKIETSCSPYVAANQSLQAWTESTSKHEVRHELELAHPKPLLLLVRHFVSARLWKVSKNTCVCCYRKPFSGSTYGTEIAYALLINTISQKKVKSNSGSLTYRKQPSMM